MRILIIEDNPDIAGNIGDYLELQDHCVDFASDGLMGLRLATEHTFDAIILDINLPRLNGFELCQKLRLEHQLETPVLMLTARDSLADKVTGFTMGAWDYLVKPFELKELEMRVAALAMRRTANRKRVITVGELVLNIDQWTATRNGKYLELHTASLKILEVLMRASPNVVSRNELEEMLWGDHPPGSDPLRSHIHELRKELDKPFKTQMLMTRRGIGFALVAESETAIEKESGTDSRTRAARAHSKNGGANVD